MLVDWAVRLARDAFAVDGEFAGMEALKFQQLVRPGTDLQAQLDWRPGTLTFRFSSDAGVHASGRLHFAGGEGA